MRQLLTAALLAAFFAVPAAAEKRQAWVDLEGSMNVVSEWQIGDLSGSGGKNNIKGGTIGISIGLPVNERVDFLLGFRRENQKSIVLEEDASGRANFKETFNRIHFRMRVYFGI